MEQLLCIMEIMATPPQHLIEAASRKKVFFDANNQPTVVPNSRGEAGDLLLQTAGIACCTCRSSCAVDVRTPPTAFSCLVWLCSAHASRAYGLTHVWNKQR